LLKITCKNGVQAGVGRGQRGTKCLLGYTAYLARDWHFAELLAKLK